MKILWIFFGGHHKIGLYLGVISMHFRVFLKVMVQNGGYLFGLVKFQIFFLGCLKFLIFLGVNGRCWARVYVWRKNKSTPPPPPGSRPDFSGHSKIDKTKVFVLNDVKSIAKCSPWSILQYSWPALSDNDLENQFWSYFEWPLQTGSTVLHFYLIFELFTCSIRVVSKYFQSKRKKCGPW